MESKQPENQQKGRVEIILTGFNKWRDVSRNPTEEITLNLIENRDSLQEQFQIKFKHIEIVNVACQDANEFVSKTYSKLKKESQDQSQENQEKVQYVVVHLGLAGGRQEYSIESMCYNNASITSADNREFKCYKQLITKQHPLDYSYKSLLPLEQICKDLKGVHEKNEISIPCNLSTDPGRYLCNYLYFTSTHEGNKHKIPTLFIHTPNIPQEKIQKATGDICRILQVITKNLIC